MVSSRPRVLPLAAAIPALALALSAQVASPHDLHHSVEQSDAAIVTLYYGDGSAYAFESYEIYRAGEEIPYQVGRTDGAGRISFLPDLPGSWTIKAFSEDGHGGNFVIETAALGLERRAQRSPIDRWIRIGAGLAALAGIFAVLGSVLKRRRR